MCILHNLGKTVACLEAYLSHILGHTHVTARYNSFTDAKYQGTQLHQFSAGEQIHLEVLICIVHAWLVHYCQMFISGCLDLHIRVS